ncbi:hypothetical protein GCM10017557_20030 [Streptomyces aurantiacus]|uniref:Uncharacterized protein n=1 Tax=Streptomyces aurantiacus TaxID=47760 RepID=A0A7G1NZU8_9ACTN|nr:hypothetical protein GCM10017557_20030 [Streptomyces aurantiacus]
MVELVRYLTSDLGELEMVGLGGRIHDPDQLVVRAAHDPLVRLRDRDTVKEAPPGLGFHAGLAVFGFDDLEEIHGPLAYRPGHIRLPAAVH